MQSPRRPWLGLLAALLLAGCAEDWGTDLDGQAVTADQMDGRWKVINYWAEWCAPCRKEVPELNRLSASAEAPLVLGVNFDGLQGGELREAADALGIRFRVLTEDPAERLELPRSPVLPVTYLVDGEGRVREQLVGEQTAEGLRQRIAALSGDG
ncbi:TlpA family protein disulfide reductase [Stutzerimonas azotifigens]|uniref:TlpA family protein disulfide reductase n=1 Tax=Stutzerimonas azotifigens TaxID=291995 RepID=UPI0003F844E9|nr:TlpA disulfide reductase family protein [Stutzerimonas azotifigens]